MTNSETRANPRAHAQAANPKDQDGGAASASSSEASEAQKAGNTEAEHKAGAKDAGSRSEGANAGSSSQKDGAKAGAGHDEKPEAEANADTEAKAHKDETKERAGADGEDVTLSAEEYHQLTEERDEYKDKFIRKVAELDNVIRRTAKEKSDLAKFGNEGFIKELLPVLDSFDQALPEDSSASSNEANDKANEDFAAGMKLVKKKLLDVFAQNGVEVVDDKGKPFDPNLHQAIQKIEDESVEVETISEQYQKGYTLNGRLVRPAMVVVAVPSAKK